MKLITVLIQPKNHLKYLIYKEVFVIFFFLFMMTSCTIIGSKEVFYGSENSAWNKTKHFSEDTYRFQCKDLIIDIDELMISSQIFAFGPIIPFIPYGKKDDWQDQNIELKVRYMGKVDDINFEKKQFGVRLFSADRQIQAVSSEFISTMENSLQDSQNNWFQYVLLVQYPNKRGNFDQLALQLFWPFDDCEPPILNLEKKKISANAFILGPGS